MDAFLDKAMGVPWVKRGLAVKGSQTQKLRIEDGKVLGCPRDINEITMR